MAQASNQHWIPRSYLKAWCDPGRKDRVVHRYTSTGAYFDYRPPSRIFSQQHLYTVGDRESSDLRVEADFLKRIEDWFLKVRRALENGRTLPPDYRQAMAWFIAAMRNRSPAARDHWQRLKDQTLEISEQIVRAAEQATPAERKRMSRSVGNMKGQSFSIEEIREHTAQTFGRWLPGHVKIEAAYLEKMALRFLRAPAGKRFITSDNPVAWSDVRGILDNAPLGLGMRITLVTMPMSPSLCAEFHHTADEDQLGEVTPEYVDHVNSLVLAQCDDFFIASSPDLVVDRPRKHSG